MPAAPVFNPNGKRIYKIDRFIEINDNGTKLLNADRIISVERITATWYVDGQSILKPGLSFHYYPASDKGPKFKCVFDSLEEANEKYELVRDFLLGRTKETFISI